MCICRCSLCSSAKDQTYVLGDFAVVIRVHQLEGFFVLGLLPRELGPGEHPVLVLVVGVKQLVHILPEY